jgi:hypothetical protein
MYLYFVILYILTHLQPYLILVLNLTGRIVKSGDRKKARASKGRGAISLPPYPKERGS